MLKAGTSRRRLKIPARPLPSRGRVSSRRMAEVQGQLEEQRKLAEGYLDRLMRLQAEFENFRKRTEREREEQAKRASERIVSSLIDVMENLERAVEIGEAADDLPGEFLDGVRMTLEGLREVLSREGLSPIKAVGKPFDPIFHEAIGRTESQEHAENMVVKEVMRGYLLNSRVLRPAKVEVSSGTGK
jgi:molecular chaperone GrpE